MIGDLKQSTCIIEPGGVPMFTYADISAQGTGKYFCPLFQTLLSVAPRRTPIHGTYKHWVTRPHLPYDR